MEDSVAGSGLVVGIEKLLVNPLVRVVAVTSLLVITVRGVAGLLFGLVDLLGVFERLFFEFEWNLVRGQWLAIFVVVAAWIALGSIMKFDTVVLAGAAGAFLFLEVVMNNIRRDLPEILDDLYGFLPPALILVGAALGFVTLVKAAPADLEAAPLFGKAASNLGLGGGAPTPMGMPSQAPPPTAEPAAVPAPVAPVEPGWLPDPQGEAKLRYWDGSSWTEHTHNG